MTDLKTRFDLNREVPLSQERLSWELPRFLEAASKRGKIVIVIDGLHRLISNDEGTEAAFNWLPLTFPPNVRVVLSATVAGADKFLSLNGNAGQGGGDEQKANSQAMIGDSGDDKKPRIIIELERRN